MYSEDRLVSDVAQLIVGPQYRYQKHPVSIPAWEVKPHKGREVLQTVSGEWSTNLHQGSYFFV